MATKSTTEQASTLSENNEETIESFNWDKTDPTGNIADDGQKKDVNAIIEEEEETVEEEETTEEVDENEEEETVEEEEAKEKKKIEDKPKAKKDAKESDNKNNKGKDKEVIPGQEEDIDATPKEIYASLLEDLKDNGNLEFVDIPKKKEVSRKEFFELQNKNDELRLDNSLKELFGNLDEKGAAYIKFIKDGGKTEDFIDTFVNNSLPELDVEDPKTHKNILEYYYGVVEEQSPEEVKESIELLEEAGKDMIAKRAKLYYGKMKKADEEAKATLLQSTQRKAAKEARDREEFTSRLKETLTQDEINGVPLTGDDKKTLGDFISKPTKIIKGNKVTMLQYELNEVLKDDKKLVILAKLLKNKFDFKFLEGKAKTKIAQGVRRGLERINEGGKAARNNATTSKKSLADYFGE